MKSLLGVLSIALVLATSGCTVAGAALGAAKPRYESSEWPRETVELGAEVRVRMRKVGSDAVATEVRGRYGGIRDGLLSVTDESGREHELAIRDVVELDVRRGSHWREGLLLGAAADAIIVVGAIAVANGADLTIATGR